MIGSSVQSPRTTVFPGLWTSPFFAAATPVLMARMAEATAPRAATFTARLVPPFPAGVFLGTTGFLGTTAPQTSVPWT